MAATSPREELARFGIDGDRVYSLLRPGEFITSIDTRAVHDYRDGLYYAVEIEIRSWPREGETPVRRSVTAEGRTPTHLTERLYELLEWGRDGT